MEDDDEAIVIGGNKDVVSDFADYVKNRLPTNRVSDLWHLRKSIEIRTYLVTFVYVCLAALVLFAVVFGSRAFNAYRHNKRMQAIMRGATASSGTVFTLGYHAHLDIKTFEDVDSYSRAVGMQQTCRPITRREYITRTLDHDESLSLRMKSVDFRQEDELDDFEEGLAAAAGVDLEFLTHALCHHAHTLHINGDPRHPVFVTPKMLSVADLQVALRKGSDEKVTSPFVKFSDFALPDVCIMAYVRPDDDYTVSNVGNGAIPSTQEDKMKHGRKPFEKALGLRSDVFSHVTDVAIWPEDAGYDEEMSVDNANRMYVVDDRHKSDSRFPTRSWWNSALYDMGPAGECALYVNPKFENDTSTKMKKARNKKVDIFRRSALVPKHNGKDVLFGSQVWRNGALAHDMVLNATLPDALLSLNSSTGFLHDDSNSVRVRVAYDSLSKNAEMQIVLDIMNGQWDVFDEFRRGMYYEQHRKSSTTTE